MANNNLSKAPADNSISLSRKGSFDITEFSSPTLSRKGSFDITELSGPTLSRKGSFDITELSGPTLDQKSETYFGADDLIFL